MTTLKKLLDSLTEQLKEENCYKNYQETLKKIQEDSALYGRLNEYRKKNVELHIKRQPLKEEALLEKEYHDLIHEDLVHEFLYWEQETLKLLRAIHKQVDEAMQLDYSFL